MITPLSQKLLAKKKSVFRWRNFPTRLLTIAYINQNTKCNIVFRSKISPLSLKLTTVWN